MILRLILIGLLALGFSEARVFAETPTEAVDRVWNAWGVAGPGDDKAGAKKFRLLSKAVALEQGTAIIAPIMMRAKDWKGEEVLIFLAAVAYLPPEKSEPILKHYKKQGQSWERQAADDLLIELDSSDMKEMLKQTRNE